MSLNDRVAIVTGASRGIGRAIAIDLAARGASVVVNYNASPAAANEVVEAITAAGGTATAVQANVGDAAQVEALFKAAVDAYGKVDILVNNAGTTRDNLIIRMKPEDFDAVIETNLRSAWLCCKAAIGVMMRKRYGRIINVSSVSGVVGQAGQTNYSASKAGMIGLTKSLAREYANRGITVNAVAPGFVLTDLTKDLPEDLVKQLNAVIPVGRWGTVEEVAKAVAFFATKESAYITGQVLNVDGGMAM
ncbi:MAG: 3-oxoacyl-[acyl-carrier-protein] reductase [Anaerolineae bacterium]|nr:3-oxoacyl-[acyl-carrier-protein] reductase [Chloroflexota bacterium]MBV6435682.1 3-oxoacyl-[acyl-carrier-protein] reductase FabG [Anaerolineae bacterium]MDL1916571.1 3-oxoacyl-[acyl-carrier-protein] reductase [Anaerolineae bacterium CFX4]MCO6445233.1 3-oxoacyl-[acyl-carrier-protein] reductase [Anaerolineae bacterium]RIK22574.1 MAG: 3-oxoacyl-[acyl-carrier-protein] reductase [Chloroflexota bacterium]